MKAYVKVNIQLQYEGNGTEDGSKYALSSQHAGQIEVADVGEGERAIVMLENHIASTFRNMGVTPHGGDHKPNLAAAFGGEQPKADS